MELDVLTAISPIDGRYRGKTKALAAYFSEFALIKYRIQVEVEYFITLCELPLPQLKGIDNSVFETLRNIYRNFSEADAQRIKDIESVTNHDVKAVEYFLKEEFDKMGGMDDYKEFIHFGLTSQDINNTSVPLSIKEALDKVYYPLIEELIAQLKTYATDWADIPMLAKTHGQPASPTRLGKEVMVFVYRLERQLAMLKACPITAKFGGATGNYNAHHVAYPQYDWKQFGNRFVAEKLGLEREEYTTQISNYDNLSAVFDAMKRINTIMVDMNRDFWQYISMEYFKQKIKAGEVGSSAMPHKVNPIDFENAEGNLGIATSILEHLAVKLPVSRLQRDLTDSTVLRNVCLFRPPYGDYDNNLIIQAKNCGYYTIQWNVDSLDWKNYGVDSIVNTVLNHKDLKNGSIILMHNGAKYTKDALERVITGLQDKGYEIVPISQLIYTGKYHMDNTGRQFKDE